MHPSRKKLDFVLIALISKKPKNNAKVVKVKNLAKSMLLKRYKPFMFDAAILEGFPLFKSPADLKTLFVYALLGDVFAPDIWLPNS